MAAYDYQALDFHGSQQKGTLEADSLRQARQLLRERQLTPLKVEASAAQEQPGARLGGLKLSWSRGLSARDLALITRQMATLVQAGLPLEEILAAVAAQSERPRLRSMLLAVRGKVLEGHALAQSLAEFPRAFPHLYRATVAAGEHSGHLDLVMNRLADYTENSQVFRQKIQMAMIYPILLLLLSILIVSGLMVYVVPDVIKVFVGTGQELPALTQGLVALSALVSRYGWLLLLAVVASVIALRYCLRLPKFRMRLHRQWLHLPLVKRLSRGFNTARYASTLSILSSSGVPLVDGMKIASEVLSNEYLQQHLHTATQRVSEGMSLHRALAESGYFPPMMLHMIASGEASGELDAMLARTAQYQERDLQSLVTVMVGLFEPAMLLLMGVTVLLIVLAILLPILNLNQLVA